MRWNGGTVSDVNHTELAVFVPEGKREDDDEDMDEDGEVDDVGEVDELFDAVQDNCGKFAHLPDLNGVHVSQNFSFFHFPCDLKNTVSTKLSPSLIGQGSLNYQRLHLRCTRIPLSYSYRESKVQGSRQ